jgi:hypothetical protein
MDATDALDTKIFSAFNKSLEHGECHCATLGTVAEFQVLSPRLFGDSFQALATLPDTVDLHSPSLQIVPGAGSDFATRFSLHSHCDAMMEEGCNQSEPGFVDFVLLGFSFVMQGGHLDDMAAAVSFVIQPHGIFVDAMAVSHSRHSGACKLTKDFFHPATLSQRALLRNVDGGSFQGQGLETFLICLIARCAMLKCPESWAICLKCTRGNCSFASSTVSKWHLSSTASPSSSFLLFPNLIRPRNNPRHC